MSDNPSEIEKSMVPPTDDDGSIQLPSFPVSDSIEEALSQLVNLNPENILHEPTCMLCSDPHRSDVEKKWVSSKNYEETKTLFKSRNNAPISNDVIDNHMRNHFERGIKELQKVEYINKIRRLSNVELTTLDRIRFALATIDERIAGINSITPDSTTSVPEIEQIKSAETTKLMSAYNNLLKLKTSITGEMKDTGQLIILPKQAFIDVFNTAITQSNTKEEKELLNKVLTSLFEINKRMQ